MEILMFTLFLGFLEIRAQSADDSQQSTGITSFQQLDRTVVDSVLKIVDDKFDSLSERITSLERAVNGLQYYNVRQFKVVSSNLNSVERMVQGMNSQVGLIGVENKGLKISIDSVKRDMKSMEKVNNMMFDAMEQNFNYLNKGFSEKLENLQGMVSVINQSSDEISQKMKDALSNVSPTTEQNCSSLFEKFEEKIDLVINSSLTSHLQSSDERRRSSGELKLLTHTLSNLNNNLKNSITYYHHTGGLVERIVGATETVAEDQTAIREDLKEFLEKQTNITKCHNTKKPDRNIPNEIFETSTARPTRISKCEIPIQAITEFKQVLKNGSQLVELVTDLAQTSQISLKTTVVELLKEVHRMKETKTTSPYGNHQNVPIPNGFIEYDFEMLLNATKGVLQMAEAIASHTRWIPYIFHNLQFVEGQINHTLSNSRNMQLMLNQLEKNSYGVDTMNLDNISSAIGFIYKSSVKLHRLTPSLTKLLGEPEPFIVLNGGSSETEGRVEIYKKGRWGTLCGRFSNIEAAYICRHLGYMGGVSAGHGYFGPGSGMFWRINVSCLYTRQCDIVKPVINSAQCDHQLDFGVICDYMVRLRSDDESNSRSTGFLEYHYMEEWIRVCTDNWSSENTRVACRQLGFEDGIVSDPTKEYTYQSDVTAILNGVNCTGAEERLDTCVHGGWSPNTCNSKAVVHLTCS